MQFFVFKDRHGSRFHLCDATVRPSGCSSLQRWHFAPGQAVLFVRTLKQQQLQQLGVWLRNWHFNATLSPQQVIAHLLESKKLRVYREPRVLSQAGETPQTQSAQSLYLQIRAELHQILARERHQAQHLDKAYTASSALHKSTAHGKAAGEGLMAAGASLGSWLAELNDVANPLWRLKRRLDAALETYEEAINDSDSSSNIDAGLIQTYLSKVKFKDHRELVEALGFDPAKVDFEHFSEAWHSAWILAGDATIVEMITTFAKQYVGAQHSLELSRAGGGAVFEVLLSILLAITTGGIGAAVNLGSKTRHIGSFARIGNKLKALAKLLQDKPRVIKRRRRQTVKITSAADAKPTAPATAQKPVSAQDSTTAVKQNVAANESAPEPSPNSSARLADDTELAKTEGASVAQLAARRQLAEDFYEAQGMPVAKISGHLDGIDFSKPVEVATLPKNKTVNQYQVPGGPQGSYYADPGVAPSKLGISDKAKDWNTGEIVTKEVNVYETNSEVKILKSSAAEIDDIWSIPGETIRADGGSTQYFTMSNNQFTPK